MARVLEHAVAVVALERQLERPRRSPRLGILDGEPQHEPVVVDARVALRDLELVAVPRLTDVRAVRELRRLDDERVAVEMAARVADPLFDAVPKAGGRRAG